MSTEASVERLIVIFYELDKFIGVGRSFGPNCSSEWLESISEASSDMANGVEISIALANKQI